MPCLQWPAEGSGRQVIAYVVQHARDGTSGDGPGVWPRRQTLDMPQVAHLRDAVLEASPWAVNVTFEDDYDWPERGQTQADASKREVVTRVV